MKRATLILESAFALMLCSAGVCLSYLWYGGGVTLPTISVALMIPAITTVLFLCVSIGVPDLYAPGSLRFPLTLTLPILYVSMLLLTMMLMSRIGLSITRVQENLVAIGVWANGWILATAFVTGAMCLWGLGSLSQKRGTTVDS